MNNRYNYDSIELYIFNWKKVNNNSIKLYKDAINYIENVKVINCDENLILNNDNVKNIQLDDSYYYGGQFSTAINDVGSKKILGVIVGDTINVNFKKLFAKLLYTFNNYNTGIYTINDLRSPHKLILKSLCKEKNLHLVENSDCGIWFINPEIHQKLKNIDYHKISPFGWGIDKITIKECNRKNKFVIRDYSLICDQLNHNCNYDSEKAELDMDMLIKYYENNYQYYEKE
jgi:hypothetical protein